MGAWKKINGGLRYQSGENRCVHLKDIPNVTKHSLLIMFLTLDPLWELSTLFSQCLSVNKNIFFSLLSVLRNPMMEDCLPNKMSSRSHRWCTFSLTLNQLHVEITSKIGFIFELLDFPLLRSSVFRNSDVDNTLRSFHLSTWTSFHIVMFCSR